MGSAELQAKLWGAGAREWASLQEATASPLYEDALQAVEPIAGKRLLDAGCGSGLALQLAHDRLAIVSGFDATPQLVEIAKERVPSADVRVADLESFPFDDGAFDIVSAFNALQYAGRPMVALAEMKRVTVPGGKIVIGQWGEVNRCETERLFSELRKLVPPAPGTPAPLALSGDGVLERRLCEAGLHPERWGEVPAPFSYPDFETAWRAMISAGPLKRFIGLAGEDRVYAVFERVFKPSVRADGSVLQHNVFRWIVSAR